MIDHRTGLPENAPEDDDDYHAIKTELKPKIEQLEQQLEQASPVKAAVDLEGRLNRALSAISNISNFYQKSSIETKRSIIGSIYPQKLAFDRKSYRTTKINTILNCILLTNKTLADKKNRNHLKKVR